MRPEIGLVLRNPTDAFLAIRSVNQVFPEQLPGYGDRIPIIECTV